MLRGMKLTIGRLEFDVTSETSEKYGAWYTLRGKRGATYSTLRNAHRPELMFLCDARNFGPVHAFIGVWLTDKNGTLEVVA
jgi:hypothetical protein